MRKINIRPNGSKKVTTTFEKPSKTDQSWKEDCDVNNIIRKFLKTGTITHVNNKKSAYADVSEIPDLLEAVLQIKDAQDIFDGLPSDIRKRFNNSPLDMVDFLQNEKNRDEAIELGLINPGAGPKDPPGSKPSGAVVPPKETEPKSDNN